jgi:hypothetical protein
MDWGFESGTVEGWAKNPTDTGTVGLNVSTSVYHSGARSLAVSMGIGSGFSSANPPATGVTIQVPLCPSSGTVNLAGYTISAWTRLVVTSGTLPQIRNRVWAQLLNSDGSGAGEFYGGVTPLNTWLQITGTIAPASTQVRTLGILAGFTMDTLDSGFAGTLYIDDVQLLPP